MQFCLSFFPGNSSTHTMWGYRDLAKSHFVLLPEYWTTGQLCEPKRRFINPDTTAITQNERKRGQREWIKGWIKLVPHDKYDMTAFHKTIKKKTPYIHVYFIIYILISMINVTSPLPIQVPSSICLIIGWNTTFKMSIVFFQSLVYCLMECTISSAAISL